MKFTDGNWMMQDGITVNCAAHAYEVDIAGDALTVVAATRAIGHRGETLMGPLLTIALTSPMADVIRVRMSHFIGTSECAPRLPLFINGSDHIAIEDGPEYATYRAGRLTARIDKSPGAWNVEFVDDAGRTVTRSSPRGMGYASSADSSVYMHEQLDIGVGECVYGLGERFTSFVKNGQSLETWNKDGGVGSDQAYKSIPFYMTNRGYGVFVNHSGNVQFEVGTEKTARVQFSVPGESLEYYVIYGPTPKEVLEKYTLLTGRPSLPPAWSFGLWLSTSFTTNYDEQTVTAMLDEMDARRLPLHVFHFDCFWMKEFHWCDFEWNPATFPNPRAMLGRLKARGLKVCVWINPYIAQRSSLFAEGAKEGYFIKRNDGGVWQTDQWQPGMAIVDFTNPAACAWYASKLRRLLDDGVDCLKTDFGERIPHEDVVYHDGSDPERMHNFYSYLYNKTVFDLLHEVRGEGEAVLFARSAWAGAQQFPVHWGGDCFSTYESMAESLRGGLSLGLSGFGFWSHDIGGFEGRPRADVYKRWLAFGLLSSHSRLHGSTSYRVPWLFDEESVDVLRHFTHLKCELMPYLFGKAVEARDYGIPVMRPMMLEFPDDPAVTYIDRQYMLGEALLAAPVFSANGVVEYYVPKGSWTSYATGETVNGPRWVQETHGFTSIPLLVRPNTILPVGVRRDVSEYDFADGCVFRLYQIDDGCAAGASVPDLHGDVALDLTAERLGRTITMHASSGSGNKSWTIELVGIDRVESVSGANVRPGTRGVILEPSGSDVRQVTVILLEPAALTGSANEHALSPAQHR